MKKFFTYKIARQTSGVKGSTWGRFRYHCVSKNKEFPRTGYAGNPLSAASGGFEPYLRHNTKVDGGSPYEVYLALMEAAS